ncbi:MAG: dephospho-CoA kinase [Pseudomonadota bacterium]
MIKAGLTGSIGMGKSTTAEMFREEGIPVYDADKTVHELYKFEAVDRIEKAFPGTTTKDGVDRGKLAQCVLGNPEKLKLLENLIHPLVHQKEKAFIEAAEKDREKLVILDIPLLFEAGGVDRVDKIIVVTAPADVQLERVLSRPGMTEEKFAAILAKQLPDAQKRTKADYIIDTSLGLEAARTKVRQIVNELAQNPVHHRN